MPSFTCKQSRALLKTKKKKAGNQEQEGGSLPVMAQQF